MEGLSIEEKIALSDVRRKKSKEMLSDAVSSLLSLRTDVDYGDFEFINPKNAFGSDDRQAYGHQNPGDAEFELCSLSF